MNKLLKYFNRFLITAIFLIATFISAKPLHAAGEITGTIFEPGVSSPGQMQVTVQINNPVPMVPGPPRIELVYRSGASLTICDLDLELDPNNPNHSYNKPVTATCDMGSLASGEYQFILRSGGQYDSKYLPYTQGSTPVNQGEFVGTYEVLGGGTYTHRFNLSLGRVFGKMLYANVFLAGETLWWQPGAQYSCEPDKRDIELSWTSETEVSVSCNFSNMPPKGYTMVLSLEESLTTEDSVPINLRGVELLRTNEVGTTASPNRFTIYGERYSDAGGVPNSFELRVFNPSGSGFSDAAPTYFLTFTEVGEFAFQARDYSMLPPGRYDLALVNPIDHVTIIDGEERNVSITVEETASSDTCTCSVVGVAYACTPPPTTTVSADRCYVGKTPTMLCVAPAPNIPVTCSCNCTGDTTIDPGGGVIARFDTEDLTSIFGTLQNVIIAIAVVSGVFIIPYAFILMASGNPEKIQKGTDWLKSIFWGYLVVFLSGVLIRIVGGDILSLGF